MTAVFLFFAKEKQGCIGRRNGEAVSAGVVMPSLID